MIGVWREVALDVIKFNVHYKDIKANNIDSFRSEQTCQKRGRYRSSCLPARALSAA